MEKSNSEQQLQLAFPYVDLGLQDNREDIFGSTFFYGGKYHDQYGYEKEPPPVTEKTSKTSHPGLASQTSHGYSQRGYREPQGGDTKGVGHVDWNGFTKNTTFHGMKYVFDRRSIRLRR